MRHPIASPVMPAKAGIHDFASPNSGMERVAARQVVDAGPRRHDDVWMGRRHMP